jgi:hypothetical protein
VNMSAFESLFFKLNAEWFLTMERVSSLTEQDGQVAEEIINFVASSVIDWHEKNLDIDNADCQKQWEALLKSMAPFGHKLKSIQIVYTDDSQILRIKEGGLSMEAWAVSCGGLGGIFYKYRERLQPAVSSTRKMSGGSTSRETCLLTILHCQLLARWKVRLMSPTRTMNHPCL